MKFQALIDEATKDYKFDEPTFPVLKNMKEKERLIFAVRHMLEHKARAVGSLAGIVEPCEHGHHLDEKALRTLVFQSIKHSLALAKIAGVTAEDIERKFLPQNFAHKTAELPADLALAKAS